MSNKKLAIPIFVGGIFFFIVITSAGILFVIAAKNKNVNTTTPAINTTPNSTVTSVEPSVSSPVSSTVANNEPANITSIENEYKNGTYTLTSTYLVEDKSASMKMSLTVENDQVTSVVITPEAKGESGRYQARFADNVSSYVIGKKLSDAALTVNVSGASLTTDAFNAALKKIQNQAAN